MPERHLTPDDIARIVDALDARLQSRQSAAPIVDPVAHKRHHDTLENLLHHAYFIDPEQHRKDHDTIRAYLQRKIDQSQRWERIRERVMGWAIIAVIVFVVGFIGQASYDLFVKNVRDIQNRSHEEPTGRTK